MGTNHIGPAEQKELLDSQEHSLNLIRKIYVEIVQWRMHGLESHQAKANDLKRQLYHTLDDVIPLEIDIWEAPTPSQKRKRVAYGGRRTRRKGSR